MNDLSTTVQSHYLESPGDQQKWFEIPGVLDIYPGHTLQRFTDTSTLWRTWPKFEIKRKSEISGNRDILLYPERMLKPTCHFSWSFLFN